MKQPIVSCFAFGAGLLVVSSQCAAQDLFRDTIAPIFQRHCLTCHNDKDHKGDFSLQSSETAFADGYIESGNADASYLMELITTVDGKAQMPKNADPLAEHDVESIRKWIESGAAWSDGFRLSEPQVVDLNWWSLKPLERPSVPELEVTKESVAIDLPRLRLPIRTPVDAFIQKSLDEKGLAASPEADRRTLIRRIYFDLIGLPPTPAEVETFLADQRPDAWEQLVDLLLDSPQYGERWARHWLDVVHYADTHGYDKDKPRPNAWPYRDYVIRAFNNDKPYSQFVMEQISGDALSPETIDGIIATGFIAAGPWDFIGHEEVPETKIDGRVARNLDRDDMVTSTFNTFCSTTVQCARCHNHKFDPVTQEHYYSLQSVFAALDRADRAYDVDPQVASRRRELQAELAAMESEHILLIQELVEAGGPELADIDSQLSQLKLTPDDSAGPIRPEYGYHSEISPEQNATKWVQVDLGSSTSISTIRFVACFDTFNNIGHGFGFPLRYKIESSDDGLFKTGVTVLADNTSSDVVNPGTVPQDLIVESGLSARYIRFTATRLAERQNDYIFALAELWVLNQEGGNAALGNYVTSLDSIEAPLRWQRQNLVDGYFYENGSPHGQSTAIGQLESRRVLCIERIMTDDLRSRTATNREKAAVLEEALSALPVQQTVYCGTIHHGSGNFVGTGSTGGNPRPIHVLHRGDVRSTGDEVQPGTIPIIAGLDWQFALPDSHAEKDRRMALARWLVRDDNPLTWRSIVNRVWQYHFGRGIVDSPNDFGRMGKLPSHPELLDWLAVEFRDSGQSIKSLHRLIVTSSVYRQSSDDQQANAEIDRENVFLWRMNRPRLTAEDIRDSVLAISGKLDSKMYGPGFPLFEVEQPEHSPHYEYEKHDPDTVDSHRRSIYRFVVRSQPDPFMTTLDCADSSQSVAKRDETTTALQALALLNNRFMLRMSEHFAHRIRQESSDPAKQIELAWLLVTGNIASEETKTMLVEYARQHTLENACRVLFNLNEFVFVD